MIFKREKRVYKGMAKLKPKEATVEGQVPAATEPEAGKVPFTTAPAGGEAPKKKGSGKPNLVQKRQEKIKAAVEAGSPFTYKEERKNEKFECICGSQGKNPIVLLDKDQKEVRVGSRCFVYTGAVAPAKVAKARSGNAPGVSRQQRMKDALAKFVPPFKFKEKRQGAFSCLCGGKGSNQIVISDANGAEFSTGATCAESVPGVEVPAPQPKQRVAAVAGLKGSAGAAGEGDDKFTAVS